MGSNFNPLILVEKLAKLNSSIQSINTLSQWCIFHMNKAKQVVETWDRQFYCAPREQRLAFLYLANDILQNSRRKGVEFVVEFWKVLPGSLRDVIENGDEFGRNASFRLISIWDERKVFGSRGRILKEEFVKRQSEYDSRNWKHAGYKLKPPGANTLDKLVSGYQAVFNSQQDEDAILYKCRNAIAVVEKVDKDIEGDYRLGHANGSSITDELKGQNTILRDCIEQLQVFEASRSDLVAFLWEALQEQEYKLDQVRDQLQAAHTCSEQAGSICRQLLGSSGNGQVIPEQSGFKSSSSQMPQNLIPGNREQSISTIHTHQTSFTDKSGYVEDPKSAAAAVAAQLTALTSSAQVLSYAIASLEPGVISNPTKDLLSDYPSEKRAKIENDHPSYVPQYRQAAILPFSHPEQLQHNLPVTSEELNSDEAAPPPPPSSPPPLPPLPPPIQLYPLPQYLHTAMPIMNGPYGYNMSQQLPAPLPSYVPVCPINGVSTLSTPTDSYQNFQTEEGGFCSQASSLPMAP